MPFSTNVYELMRKNKLLDYNLNTKVSLFLKTILTQSYLK